MSISSSSSSSTRRLLLAIIAVAVILRVGSAFYHGTGIEQLPGVTDQISYHELAVRVVDGHGFSFATGWWPATRANRPTAHWSYLYVLFLAGIYSLAGPAPIVARLIQAVIVGILHPLLVWRIGRRLFDPAVGLASAAVTAVYGYFVYYGGALVTESLYMVAVLWALDLATALVYSRVAAGRPADFRKWVVLGAALGAAVLLRQVFLLVVPIVVAWIAWRLFRESSRGQRPWPAALALAGRLAVTGAILAACILPWTLRNYRAFGEFVPLNTNAGFVFFWGNHPVHGSEFIPILPNGPVNYATLIPAELRRLNEAQLDQALLARGLGFVADDPVRYVRLSVSRAKEFFKFWPSADSSASSNLVRVASFGLFVPFALGGLILTLARKDRERRSGMLMILCTAGAYALVHLLTWTLVRYRLPIDAMAMPLAGLGMVSLYRWIFAYEPAADVALHGSAH